MSHHMWCSSSQQHAMEVWPIVSLLNKRCRNNSVGRHEDDMERDPFAVNTY